MLIWNTNTVVPALYNRELQKLVPIWEAEKEGINLVVYEDGIEPREGEEPARKFQNVERKEFELIEAVYNLQTKEVSLGEDWITVKTKTPFKVGETVVCLEINLTIQNLNM